MKVRFDHCRRVKACPLDEHRVGDLAIIWWHKSLQHCTLKWPCGCSARFLGMWAGNHALDDVTNDLLLEARAARAVEDDTLFGLAI